MPRNCEQQRAACAMAVMVKASSPGRTKTRLVPPLTHDEAAAINTAFVRDAADNILAAAALADISGWLAYAPAGSEDFFRRHVPEPIGLIETTGSDIGECLIRAAGALLDRGYRSVCLLNSDSPSLPVGHLVAAAVALAAPGDRVVLGPSTDGGYYLVGMKRPHQGLFRDIDWSTERVFRQTLARAGELGVPVVELPAWYDVDDADSLRLIVGELFEGSLFRPSACPPAAAVWTRTYLAERLDQGDLGSRLRGAGPDAAACAATRPGESGT
jgi:rSAM/selenodomain-associated transferase 1